MSLTPRREAAGLAFLAEASRLLAASLDYETTLATVAGMALPHLGAWCFVDVVEPDGRMRRLAVVHPDPRKQDLARRLESGWPPERDDPFGLPAALRTRRSEVVPHVSDAVLVQAARTPENLGVIRALGVGSLMAVPLIARGEVLGAITYVSPARGHAYTAADLELAEDLAARCAIAILNARLYGEARDARLRAEEASRAQGEFMATMSHEIRTPINAAIGYVDLLESGIAGGLSDGQVRYLERIKASNRHLLALIDDVLDVARAEAGTLQVQAEESAAGPVVDAALDLVRPRTEGRALTLSDRCEGDPGAAFWGDVDRVRQIAANLLSNAIKFTPDGGSIRISCGSAPEPEGAEVAGAADRWTWIRVEDTGIGIDLDAVGQLFEPFVQADTGLTRAREGTGLGLAISRRLARMMGGDLTVESRPGEGSSFILWLPGAPGAAWRDGAAPPSPAPAAVDGRQERGVAAIGAELLAGATGLARAFVREVREAEVAPAGEEVPDAAVQDHVASYVSDLGQVLVLLEQSPDDAVQLLRDGSAIQRTIADRHGQQRFRLGWTEAGVARELALLADLVEEAVRSAAARHEEADPERALALLSGFLEQGRRGALRAFRMAARGAGR